MVHVGDIKKGWESCDEERYTDIAEMFVHQDNALNYDARDCFFVPGDNEWSDCSDRDQAWKYWMESFGNGNMQQRTGVGPNMNSFGTLSDPSIDVAYQTESLINRFYPSTASNFAFLTDNVLFIGINQVGGSSIGDEPARLSGNYQWVEEKMTEYNPKVLVIFAHARFTGTRWSYFGEPFTRLMQRSYPHVATLYLHGDGHDFSISTPDSSNANLIDLEVDGGEEADPLLVSVMYDSNADTYSFDVDKRGGYYYGGCQTGNIDKTWTSSY